MPAHPLNEWLEGEQDGDAIVVRFVGTCADFVRVARLKALDLRLFALLDDGARRVVASLADVERLDGLLLGKFVALHRKALAVGGRVVLCHLSPTLYDVFQTLQLTGFLRICGTEAQAVQTAGSP